MLCCDEPIERYAQECKVDPFYCRNILDARDGRWEWNSRVLPKPGREEGFVGRPMMILNPSSQTLDITLSLEMGKVIGMMKPWDLI
jgi:hypothetical protein